MNLIAADPLLYGLSILAFEPGYSDSVSRSQNANQGFSSMPAIISKADVKKVMQEMSDEGMNLDEFVERIILLSKVRSGLEQAGEGIPHDEVVEEFKKPRGERKWN